MIVSELLSMIASAVVDPMTVMLRLDHLKSRTIICSMIFGQSTTRASTVATCCSKDWTISTSVPMMQKKQGGGRDPLPAFFYFNLCKTFGSVPLIVTSQSGNEPGNRRPTLCPNRYGFAEGCGSAAINEHQWYRSTELGRTNKVGSRGLLARVYLFHTGCTTKHLCPPLTVPSLPTRWQKTLKDCIDNSGHKLMADFATFGLIPTNIPNPIILIPRTTIWTGMVKTGANKGNDVLYPLQPKSVWDTPNTVKQSGWFVLLSPWNRRQCGKQFPLGIGMGIQDSEPKDDGCIGKRLNLTMFVSKPLSSIPVTKLPLCLGCR